MSDATDSLPSCVIEVHTSLSESLGSHLKNYKLRSAITIEKTHLHTYIKLQPSLFGDIAVGDIYKAISSPMLINEGDIISDVEDPRLLVTPRNESTRLLVKGFPPDYPSFNQKELQNKHDIYRLIHGLAEGGEVLGHIPLEVNLDLLNYINFQKGCYIGQELVARTKFKVSCGHGMFV